MDFVRSPVAQAFACPAPYHREIDTNFDKEKSEPSSIMIDIR